jgi:hypothetical protein
MITRDQDGNKSQNHKTTRFSRLFIPLLAVCLLVGMTYANLNFSQNNPGGNDFLARWGGTRLFLFKGMSPYSEEAGKEVQLLYYGRLAKADEEQGRLFYPLYSLVFYAPFALINDYVIARALWMTLLEIAALSLAYFSIQFTKWKPHFILLTCFFLFSITWYFSVRAIINGNIIMLVSLGITAAFAAMKSGRWTLSGILLAFTTVKPQVVLLIILFTLYWSLQQREWRLLIGFLCTMLILAGISTLLIPDWVIQNFQVIGNYPAYPPGNIIAALELLLPDYGKLLGWIIIGVCSLLLIFEWAATRYMLLNHYFWLACLTLVISQWVTLQSDPGNQIILFQALALAFSTWYTHWGKVGHAVVFVSMILLLLGLWLLFITTVSLTGNHQPIQNPVMFFPLPIFLIFALYSIRNRFAVHS